MVQIAHYKLLIKAYAWPLQMTSPTLLISYLHIVWCVRDANFAPAYACKSDAHLVAEEWQEAVNAARVGGWVAEGVNEGVRE